MVLADRVYLKVIHCDVGNSSSNFTQKIALNMVRISLSFYLADFIGSQMSVLLSSVSKVHFSSSNTLSFFLPRCNRTLTLSTVMSSTSAISRWLKSPISKRTMTLRSDSGRRLTTHWTHLLISHCSRFFWIMASLKPSMVSESSHSLGEATLRLRKWSWQRL